MKIFDHGKEKARKELEEHLERLTISEHQRIVDISLYNLMENFGANEIVLGIENEEHPNNIEKAIYVGENTACLIDSLRWLEGKTRSRPISGAVLRDINKDPTFYDVVDSSIIQISELGVYGSSYRSRKIGEMLSAGEEGKLLASWGQAYQQTKVIGIGLDLRDGYRYAVLLDRKS